MLFRFGALNVLEHTRQRLSPISDATLGNCRKQAITLKTSARTIAEAGIGYHLAMAQAIRTYTEIADQNSLLADWRGSKAEVWIFHLTFRRLAVLLRLPERSEVLYVVGLGCRHINGPFSWQNAKLSISAAASTGSVNPGEHLSRVYDLDGQFELVCSGGVVLLHCSEIVNSFDEVQFPS